MKNQHSLETKSRKKLVFNVKKSLLFVFVSFFVLSCVVEKKNDCTDFVKFSKEIKVNIASMMQEQEDAWNEGDLEEFMKYYWKSDSLQFIGKSGLNKGWQTTLDNYKKSYPNKKTMGNLKFNVIKLEVNGNSAFMLGKWSLIRENDNPNGHFALYWKKINEKWLITIDHTS